MNSSASRPSLAIWFTILPDQSICHFDSVHTWIGPPCLAGDRHSSHFGIQVSPRHFAIAEKAIRFGASVQPRRSSHPCLCPPGQCPCSCPPQPGVYPCHQGPQKMAKKKKRGPRGCKPTKQEAPPPKKNFCGG